MRNDCYTILNNEFIYFSMSHRSILTAIYNKNYFIFSILATNPPPFAIETGSEDDLVTFIISME
jgi:hypothetical protein